MENNYECPRCHNVFPSFNKIMHDAKCTEQNPLPLNNSNLQAPAPIGNKEENVSQLFSLFNNININDDNNNININNENSFNFNFDNNINNNIDNINAFGNIINEPPKDNFPQTFICDICHEMFMEKERNDHMLCHNLEKEDKKNEIRISRIDVEEQKEIEKQIESNRRNLINQQRINQNNLNNNNNFYNINNIQNINNNNNNRRNINNNQININQNNRNNLNIDNNNNINQRMENRIREGVPNVQANRIQNNRNNEIRNNRRYRRSNSYNASNYDIHYPNDLITFNRHGERQRFVPIMYENNDNGVRATDKQILNNLPETQIEDVSKLDSEKKNCVICLEDFKNKDKAIILPCIHLFHKNCINNWLKTKNICPICKFKLTSSNIESKNNNFQ